MPDGAEAEERRDHGQAQPVALRDEVLDSGEHAVLGPALARRRVGVGQAVRRAARARRGTARLPLSGGRLAEPVGNQLGGEVVVAAGVRPGHVVEEQQRQVRAGARSPISRSSSLTTW